MSDRLFSVITRVEFPNGFALDIHDFRDGQVWYQRWCPGIERQSWFTDLHRMPVANFNEAMNAALAVC